MATYTLARLIGDVGDQSHGLCDLSYFRQTPLGWLQIPFRHGSPAGQNRTGQASQLALAFARVDRYSVCSPTTPG